MADGPIPREDSGVSVAVENEKLSPKKGVALKLAESQRSLEEAQKEAEAELILQYGGFYHWAMDKGSQMPVVEQENDKITRKGIWKIDGGKSRSVTLTSSGRNDLKVDVKDSTYELSIRNRWMRLAGGDIEQFMTFNYRSQTMEYYKGKIAGTTVPNDQVPDMFDYSRKVLDFLGRATMQSAVPPSQPANG